MQVPTSTHFSSWGVVPIRLGEPVTSEEGPYGELADLVVDPMTHRITHVVVQPVHRHEQARLVPMRLVAATEGALVVDLDEAQIEELARVAERSLVHLGEPLDPGEGWDVGASHLTPLLDWDGPGIGYLMPPASTYAVASYDRIPPGGRELRDRTVVVTSDECVAGHLAGVLVRVPEVVGFVVETGHLGFRHLVIVPSGAVASVETDRVAVFMDHRAFHDTPHSDSVFESQIVRS